MNRLDTLAFDRARNFMLTRGAPVPRAVFRSLFEAAGTGEVLAALAPFQNADGGFGHGIEPDFHLPASSPMATSVAFGVLREVAETGDVPAASVAGRAVFYLVDAYDRDLPGWRPVPPAVNDHPHAPWWSRSAESFDAPMPPAEWGNPNAELAGILLEHAQLVPRELVATVVADAVGRLAAAPTPIGPYVCLSYLRLAEVAREPERDAILNRLRADALETLDQSNPIYAHFPYHWLAPTPDAPLADLLSERVAADLDAQIAAQTSDGCWDPGWSWGPAYPDAWEQAREAWRGELTLRTLCALRAWGRIEGA